MSMHRDQGDLADLSHEALSVDPSRDERAFEITQHVVTDSAPEEAGIRRSRRIRLIRHP